MPSTSTANWITDRQLRSVCTTTFATLRCTNTSPGWWPVIWFAGTRLSEQPIHRMRGRWMAARRSKNPGSCARMRSDHRRLFSRTSRRSAMGSLPDTIQPAAVSGFGVRERTPDRERPRAGRSDLDSGLRGQLGLLLRACGLRLGLARRHLARTLADHGLLLARGRRGRLLLRLARTRGDDAGAAEQRSSLRRRLRALRDPALDLLLVHLHGEGLRHRVVVTE